MKSAAKQTLTFDCLRYFFQGALDVEFRTVILLIAIKVFNMPTAWKAVITSIGFLSMIFTPVTQQIMNRSRWNAMQFSAIYFIIIGISLLTAASLSNLILFCVVTSIARICYKQQIPLMISVYRENYTQQQRGTYVGIALACLSVGGILFSQWSRNSLTHNPEQFENILIVSGIFSLIVALCFLKIPTRKIIYQKRPPLWENFKILAQDLLFSKILFLWSLIAIATQMTAPLRIEYLANHKSGLDLSPATVLGILSLAQPIARIISGPIWGKFYTQVTFTTMRQTVTLFFLIGVPLFFATDNLYIIYIASILIGIGHGGGGVIWSLWVTHIAPKDRVSEYMSADTAIIGLRDGLAPAIGYLFFTNTSPATTGMIAAILLFLSIVGFYKISKQVSERERAILTHEIF